MTESDEDSYFQTLAQALQLSCSQCGEQNSLRAVKCQACGAPVQQKESDPKSLSFLHAEGISASPQSTSSSHKLRRLQLALEGVRTGEVDLDLYHAVVGQVLAETEALREVINLQALRSLEHKFSAEAIDVMRETSDNIDAFFQACERMLAYDGSNIQLADEGLALAEATLVDMQATQQEAAELQSQYGGEEPE